MDGEFNVGAPTCKIEAVNIAENLRRHAGLQEGWQWPSENRIYIRLKPTLLQNTQKYLPDNLKTVLQEPISAKAEATLA